MFKFIKNFFKKNDELHDRYFYDSNIKRYVIGSRRENFYYADISYNGLSYYRSRWCKNDDTFIEMDFEEWFQHVITQITKDFENNIMKRHFNRKGK